MVFEIILFAASILALSFFGARLVKNLTKIGAFLGIREFVVAFFIMAFATSLTNLFVALGAAFRGLPELSFADILGGNLIDLTLVMALVIFFSKKNIAAKSKMVQTSAFFTGIAALLPLVLIFDGKMSRVDGLILYLSFAIYSVWLFSKNKRFKKEYKEKKKIAEPFDFIGFVKSIFNVIMLIAVLIIASQAIIYSAQVFASGLGVSLAVVGLLIVSLGNCFPEAYFSIIAARKGEGYLVLGEMMGSVIICATLILGTIAIISPFEIHDFSPYLIARFFMILAVVFFIFLIRSDKKFTKKEGILLLLVYIVFLLSEIFVSKIN